MNTISKLKDLGFTAVSLTRQFRRATTVGLLIGLTTGAAIAGGVSVSLGGNSAASVDANVGSIGGSVTVGGGSVASVGGTVGGTGGNVTVGGNSGLANANVDAPGIAGASVNIGGAGSLANVCVKVLASDCKAQAMARPVSTQKPATQLAVSTDDDLKMPKGRICLSKGNSRSLNGYSLTDRRGTMIGWVQGAQIDESGSISGLTVMSTRQKCLTLKGGSYAANGNRITTNADAARFQ